MRHEDKELQWQIVSLQSRVERLKNIVAMYERDGVKSELYRKVKLEIVQIEPSKEFTEKIGWAFYFMYKKAHPEINAQTRAEEISLQQLEYGFRWLLPQEQQEVTALSDELVLASKPMKTIDVTPKMFEEWAASRYFRVYLAYVPQVNTVFFRAL